MNVTELVVFIIYFILVLVIGLYFFLKTRHGGEKEFFLGGRKMNGLVSEVDHRQLPAAGVPAGELFTHGLGLSTGTGTWTAPIRSVF